ncbi:MAG: vWA domain-containing protein [Armatimonadota bacterium]|jgi:VWFA-related protein
MQNAEHGRAASAHPARALVILGLVVVVVTIVGCSGGFGPTLPSPDGVVTFESRVFSLLRGEQFVRGARLADFTLEERLCGSIGEYTPAQLVRLEEDRDFQAGGGQANLAVIFDRSGSMGEGTGSKLEDARAAANELIDLKNASDMMAIVPFDEDVEVTQGFTADADLLHDAVNAIESGSGTSAWDGTIVGAQIVSALNAPGRSAVVLMSDGRDSRSEASLDEAIAEAQARRIPVYAIGFQTEGQANLDMRRLSTETGGQFFEAATREQLTAAFFTILEAVQGGQYAIYWRSNFAAGTNVEVRIVYRDGDGEIEVPPACQVILGGDQQNGLLD